MKASCVSLRTYPRKIFRRFAEDFWPIFASNCEDNIDISILSPQFDAKIGSKSPGNRQKLFTWIGSSILLIFLFGCGNPPYRGGEVLGADEFVMDSYKIREGKFAILEMEGRQFEGLSPELLEEYKDLIQDGDLLQIMLYHPSRQDLVSAIQEISSRIGFRVVEGKILLPDIGNIDVKGLTLDDARAKIQERYDNEIKDTTVYLAYKDRPERRVELAGLVQIPSLPIDGKIRLFEILSLAKVPPQANLFKSYVIRKDQLLPVDLYKLIKEGDMSQNIVMREGDKIYIAEEGASSIMVLGEVGTQGVVELPRGAMTLSMALAKAGGLPFTADRSYIQIIRGSISHPKVYTLHWKHVVRLPSDSLLLMPGDIVYVAATPIAEWNRFVSQILPTLIGFDLLTKGANSVGITVP
jgi:polysaccharide biosynthesis/export protein